MAVSANKETEIALDDKNGGFSNLYATIEMFHRYIKMNSIGVRPVRPCMTGAGGAGAYQSAFDLSLHTFRSRNPQAMAESSNCPYDPERGEFDVVSLGQPLGVRYPQGTVYCRDTDLLPNWEWRLLALNYLGRSDGAPVARRLVSYRQLEHGHLFYPAFENVVIAPLASSLARDGINVERIGEACLNLGAKLVEASGVMAEFPLLPRFPVTVQIWPGDEEMAGSANVLFDASATHYLHIEDIAGAGYQVARFLMQEYDLLERQARGE